MINRILIIDDDESISEVMRTILQRTNREIIIMSVCQNVAEVVKLKPDLILMDLWMPHIGGDRLTRMLKKDSRTKHLPIVMVSAHNDASTIAKDIGADSFLAKPFDIDDLENVVSSYLPQISS
jgi:CheY-like chemotaxis protein